MRPLRRPAFSTGGSPAIRSSPYGTASSQSCHGRGNVTADAAMLHWNAANATADAAMLQQMRQCYSGCGQGHSDMRAMLPWMRRSHTGMRAGGVDNENHRTHRHATEAHAARSAAPGGRELLPSGAAAALLRPQMAGRRGRWISFPLTGPPAVVEGVGSVIHQ